MSPLQIPTTFHPDQPGQLKTELERLSNGLDRYARDLALEVESRPMVRKPELASTFAAFGALTRIRPADGQTIVTQLPAADPRNGGKVLRVLRLSSTGVVYLRPIDCLINGRDDYLMTCDVGFVTVLFDGENYYTDVPGAVPWSGP
jgi:hypothetical protein